MYAVDSEAGPRWLALLKQHPGVDAAWVVDVQPSLRVAHDGSTEVLTMVVLQDRVLQEPPEKRERLLSELERHLRRIIQQHPFLFEGWPLVGFMTESDVLAHAARG
ncbi:MAG: hypothetical protein MUF64_06630 [Polyangiaceae bacterium]|nr:hypothetical protein [Polyangiaceae bacterium]